MAAPPWVLVPQAEPELNDALTKFSLPPLDVKAYLIGGLDYITKHRRHPEELPRRRAIHAFPALWYGNIAWYVLFARPNDFFRVLLHLPTVEGPLVQYPATLYQPRPQLPSAAWDLAATRLEMGGW